MGLDISYYRSLVPAPNPALDEYGEPDYRTHFTILLKRAFRNSLFVYHPDHGGTNDQARAAYAAFGRLSKRYDRGQP